MVTLPISLIFCKSYSGTVALKMYVLKRGKTYTVRSISYGFLNLSNIRKVESTWGTENNLVEINLERMEGGGEIKGCNIFLGEKLANTCSFVGGRIIMQQEKASRAERSWTNPWNVLQEAIHYSFVIFCIYCFSLWYVLFVHYALRVKKLSTWS
jgi:hypothetical protein